MAATKKQPTAKKDRKETVRVRSLKALKQKGDMTAAEVQETIGLQHGLKPTLDQEVERGHLSFAPHKDDSATTTYRITAAGKKALESGTVDPARQSKKPAKKSKAAK